MIEQIGHGIPLIHLKSVDNTSSLMFNLATFMITSIHIRNLGILESVDINFKSGFHVISGETGAGKSIFLQAIAFALGARADADWIRTGAQEASVTLQLELPKSGPWQAALAALEIPWEAGAEVQLRRTLNEGGRSRGFVNDVPVTLKTLQQLGESWIHIVGQHSAQGLFEQAHLLALLDRYAGVGELAQKYRDALKQYRECAQDLATLQSRAQKTREQEDFLRFQFEELAKAALVSGEEEELTAKKNRMKHQVALVQLAYELGQGLQDGEGAVADQLGRLLHHVQKAQALDATFAAVSELLEQARTLADEAGRWVDQYRSKLNEDPEELDRIESRLSFLSDLKRKYRMDLPGLVERVGQLKIQMGELENLDGLLEAKANAVKNAATALQGKADQLRQARRKAAGRLSSQVEKALKDLALPHAQLEFSLHPVAELENYREDGADLLAVQISFNPGEEKRPLNEVASGGELSRLLLALYEILFPPEEFIALVFDEVDTGVGGRVAELIGKKLESLSAKTQLFCVTHLPQIACHGEWHYVVEKEVKGKRTYSQIRCLAAPEREGEIARMLAGVEVTAQALKHAREMLKGAAA